LNNSCWVLGNRIFQDKTSSSSDLGSNLALFVEGFLKKKVLEGDEGNDERGIEIDLKRFLGFKVGQGEEIKAVSYSF